jgi:hypothetical protein
MNPPIWLKQTISVFLVALVLTCFGLAPTAHAQLPPPPPDGGYPNFNTAEGDSALFSLTSGFSNTAIGFEALLNNTTGGGNTATGFNALRGNTTGAHNTATGADALESNTTASNNTATGSLALPNNTTGTDNTATGFNALFNNTTGGSNTATGLQALDSNTTGGNNTANGENALFFNTTGFNNTAEGFQALLNNTGSSNIAVGSNAGINLTTGSNNIDIGNTGVAGESGTIRIGTQGTQTKAFVAGIHGVPVTGVAVKVTAAGQLGVAPSSARFKEQIKPMDKASEAILALKPVTFRYKHELDLEGIPQFGLVAEQVEKVNPDLVARDEHSKPYTVRYEAVNAMLLNEFLKEHKRVEEQQATIAELKGNSARQEKISAQQQKEIDALTAVVQKVNAQLEVSKAAPQTVLNNQ